MMALCSESLRWSNAGASCARLERSATAPQAASLPHKRHAEGLEGWRRRVTAGDGLPDVQGEVLEGLATGAHCADRLPACPTGQGMRIANLVAMWRVLVVGGAMALVLAGQSAVTVEGVVTNRVTHQGISGVSVTLDRGTAGLAYRATTDASGAFKIQGVDPGDYRPIFEKRGLSVADDTGRVVHIEGPMQLRAEMIPWTRVSGKVVNTDGRPIPKVRVSLIPIRVGRNSSGTVASTDDTGSFTLAMQPGMYRLQADPYKNDDERRGEPAAEPPASTPAAPRAWAPTYYPSTTDPQGAQPITVSAGTDLSGYDIRLQSVALFHVRGTVLDTRG